VFVAAVVAIGHGHGWLDFIDGYAFLVLGKLTAGRLAVASDASTPPGQVGAFVVEIDQRRYEEQYSARAPLDRCALHRDLTRVYEAGPRLLVVDIDLSPALWLMNPSRQDPSDQKGCEERLYRLLEDHADKTRTVLVAPFELSDSDGRNQSARQTREAWQGRMRARGIGFGDAELPVTFGLTLRAHTDAKSLVGAASKAWEADNPPTASHPSDSILIDPRRYAARPAGVHLRDVDGLTPGALAGPPVFFGAAFGSREDTFLTPVGEIYGVEVHAAALLSNLDRRRLAEHHPLNFVFDLAFAAGFGVVMAWCWSRYLAGRLAGRETAGVYVVLLLLSTGVFLLGLVTVSVFLFKYLGVWASPVPIMVGMLADSVVSRWFEDPEHEVQHGRIRGSRVQHVVAYLRKGVVQALLFSDRRRSSSTDVFERVWVTARRSIWVLVVGYGLFIAGEATWLWIRH
jgi:CHASE2 domain-containing protein